MSLHFNITKNNQQHSLTQTQLQTPHSLLLLNTYTNLTHLNTRLDAEHLQRRFSIKITLEA